MNLKDSFVSDLDRKIIEINAYGKRRGFGKRPALTVIDAQNKFGRAEQLNILRKKEKKWK